ncbi:endonuclease/exonuclease/phosphatase family protein [Sorangium sp. So ce363]|uniref:endonuclease/exonuclease/phosphatase family protein n=1 Tax=Sorangium sp. So ce363 TaxID=3133304 RepID=UPI003F5E4A3F
MRLATWNLRHGGGRRVPQLLDGLKMLVFGRAPDIAVLTEFQTGSAGDELQAGLRELGLVHQSSSVSNHRQNSVLVAARFPFQVGSAEGVPPGYEHRLVTAEFDDLVVCGLYFPNMRSKAPLFDWLLGRTELLNKRALLFGDFNTGLHHLDEHGATFFCADQFAGLLKQGWVDLWRERNPEAREFSWFSHVGNGFRIDHAFGSPQLAKAVRSVSYSHEVRIRRVSDHSAMFLELE